MKTAFTVAPANSSRTVQPKAVFHRGSSPACLLATRPPCPRPYLAPSLKSVLSSPRQRKSAPVLAVDGAVISELSKIMSATFSESMAELGKGLLTIFLGGALIQIARLIFADADLALLSKGRHPPRAFRGQVVWITGASQGFGEVLAGYFARRGAKIILSSRSEAKLKRVAESCGTAPENVLVLPFDLTGSDEQLAEAVRKADAAFGGAGVDYLVHNAGASQASLADETSGKVATDMVQLNTLGPIRLTQAALPAMLQRGKGRLVVVASAAAKAPSPGQAVYSASKAALWAYFSSLATEVADRGISVTICCPGPVAAEAGAPPRMVYGANGLVQQQETGSPSKRVKATRCAELIASAAAHGVAECWISKHPVLLMCYLQQYLPSLAAWVLRKVGPGRARALKSGKSGYDVRGMLRQE